MRARGLAMVLQALFWCSANAALADRGEIYTMLSAGPLCARKIDTAPTGQVSHVSFGGGMQATAFYGITHAIHLGGALSFAYYPNAALTNDEGTLYENGLGIGAAVMAHGRWNTGRPLAPFGSLQLGAEILRYSAREWRPGGPQVRGAYSVELEPLSRTMPFFRGAVGAEYRIGDRWIATLSLAFRQSLASGAPWQIELPLSVGRIWW